MEELDHTPDTSFERDVVCEDEEAFCLSMDNIAALQNLLQQVCWHAEAMLLAVEAVNGSWQQLILQCKEQQLSFQQDCVLEHPFGSFCKILEDEQVALLGAVEQMAYSYPLV